MAQCKKCWEEVNLGMRICYTCLDEWQEKRKKAFNLTKKELGELSSENHKQFTKRLKQIEQKL